MKKSKPITGRKIRLGLVGCGRIAQSHLLAISHFDQDVELLAVCDVDKSKADQVAAKYGIDSYQKPAELLSREDIDCVVICTPSGLHAEQTIMAASMGKHIITEKPMATRLDDGRAMVKACDKAQVGLFVVKQNRFNPTITKLKQAVMDKRFGRIYMIQSNVFWTRPQSYYDQDRWRGTWEFDGGAFMNQASHYVDLLEWLFGPVESVQCMHGTLARMIEVEDTGVMNLRWRSGALGSMSVTMLAHDKNFEGSITVLGEHGTVRIGGLALNSILHWKFADGEKFEDVSYDIQSVYGGGHTPYYQNIIQAIRGEASACVDGREGLRSLELLVAGYLSSREARVVHLPLAQ